MIDQFKKNKNILSYKHWDLPKNKFLGWLTDQIYQLTNIAGNYDVFIAWSLFLI